MSKPKYIIHHSVSHAILGSALLAATMPASHAAENEATINTVTVTAQSRRQAAQAVPIPFQIVNADQLSKLGATDLSQMNGYIPGLFVDGTEPTQPNYRLRGVGSLDFGIGTDAPVGIYVDGVYTGKSGGSMMNFNDVERIEVLKGPQGTLFGRNSAGGAISIVTKEPSRQWEADAHVRLGGDGLRHTDGVLNVPLSDNVAARISAVNARSDGDLVDNASGVRYKGEHSWGTRAALVWRTPQQGKVLLSWEHQELDQASRPSQSLVAAAPIGATPTYPTNPSTWVDPRHSGVMNDARGGGREQRRFDGVTLQIERPLPWADFSSTTAYRHFTSLNRADQDGTNRIDTKLDTSNIESNTTWQQQFKLSGKNARADWLAGISLFGETAHQTSELDTNTNSLNTLFRNGAGLPVYSLLDGATSQAGLPFKFTGHDWRESMFNRGSYRAYAGYGDIIWHVSDRLNITTGARLTRDQKEFSWYNPRRVAPGLDSTIGTLDGIGFFPALVQSGALTPQQLGALRGGLEGNALIASNGARNTPLVQSKHWTDLSPRIVLDYRAAPGVMLYGSVTKGYQAGGYNSVAVAGGYAPETVINYEAGIKSELRDLKMIINASAFHYKFSNLQSIVLISNGNNNGIPSYQVSSSDQGANGLDLEMRWTPVRDTRLYLTGEWIDQTYLHYVSNNGTNLSGQPVGTPRLSAAAGIDQAWRGVFGGKLDLTLQYAYTGATRCNDDSLSQGTCVKTSSYTIGAAQQRTDTRLAWSAPSGQWSIAAWVNNLFDQRYVYNVSNLTAIFGTPVASVSSGRRVGIELRIRN
jgi:iron complex outermembrane recepter protein